MTWSPTTRSLPVLVAADTHHIGYCAGTCFRVIAENTEFVMIDGEAHCLRCARRLGVVVVP